MRKSIKSAVKDAAILAETREMEKLYRRGKTLQEIADEYGVIKQTVYARFVRTGVKRRPFKYQEINKEKLENLYLKTELTLAEIASKLKSSDEVIRQALKFYAIPKRSPLKSGGVYAIVLRTLQCSETINIKIVGKVPQARLHRYAASVGIKISVRFIGEDTFRVTRLK